MSEQVVSKKRVADHGEVYTSKRQVNDMLDLVKQETKRIDSRFLEPACGTGNFLVEILKRKLSIVDDKYHKNQLDLGKYEGTYSDEMLRKRWDITQDEWAFINSRIKDSVGKSDESYNE